jgi:hypothetical protein
MQKTPTGSRVSKMYFQREGCILFQLEVKVEMGGKIVETTGNRQMELAIDTFCVGSTKK